MTEHSHSQVSPAAPLTKEELQRLYNAATAASHLSYSPYSKFPVGAAILTRDGEVYSGTNVENVSFGLTICAERNAVAQMVAAGRRDIRAVVVYTPTVTPTTPCGACRQVLAEFGPTAAVHCFCDAPVEVGTSIDKLLPSAFTVGDLHRATTP